VRYITTMKRALFERCLGVGLRSGFSLVELLCVVAIILILATLYWRPNAASRQRALQVACQNNLQKLYIAMELYANDHAGKLPKVSSAHNSAEALDPLVPRYTAETALFICPGAADSPLPSGAALKGRKISYAYYMGRVLTNSQQVLLTDKQVDTLPKPAGRAAFSSDGKPPGNNHGKWGGNLLFCDGHVEQIPPNTPVALDLDKNEVLLNP
jgi:prepilin-type N-terminal cleavage/methylation domain-containing protein/prepilin-type processing-associated H-X9-DG protein